MSLYRAVYFFKIKDLVIVLVSVVWFVLQTRPTVIVWVFEYISIKLYLPMKVVTEKWYVIWEGEHSDISIGSVKMYVSMGLHTSLLVTNLV